MSDLGFRVRCLIHTALFYWNWLSPSKKRSTISFLWLYLSYHEDWNCSLGDIVGKLCVWNRFYIELMNFLVSLGYLFICVRVNFCSVPIVHEASPVLLVVTVAFGRSAVEPPKGGGTISKKKSIQWQSLLHSQPSTTCSQGTGRGKKKRLQNYLQ